jgi:hypothetical protein
MPRQEGPIYVRNDNEYLDKVREAARIQFRQQARFRPTVPATPGVYRTWRGLTTWVDRDIATGQVVARSDGDR